MLELASAPYLQVPSLANSRQMSFDLYLSFRFDPLGVNLYVPPGEKAGEALLPCLFLGNLLPPGDRDGERRGDRRVPPGDREWQGLLRVPPGDLEERRGERPRGEGVRLTRREAAA